MEALIAMNICAAAVALVVWHSPKWLDEIATLLAKRAFASRRSRREYRDAEHEFGLRMRQQRILADQEHGE